MIRRNRVLPLRTRTAVCVARRLRRQLSALLCIAFTGTLLAPACSESEPAPPDFRDLGDGQRVLLPPPPVWKRIAVADGQAEWRPFREPGTPPAPAPSETGSGEATAGRSGEAFDAAVVEAEIREMIEDYNAAAVRGDVEEMLEYFVDDEREAMRSLLETALNLRDIFGALRDELADRLPDAVDRIKSALRAFGYDEPLTMRVESITVESASEAKGTEAGVVPLPVHFRRIAGEWYVGLTGAEAFSAMKQMMETGVQKYRTLLEGLRSGQTAAENVLSELESAAQAAAMLRSGAGASGSAAPPQQPDDNNDEPPGDAPDRDEDNEQRNEVDPDGG